MFAGRLSHESYSFIASIRIAQRLFLKHTSFVNIYRIENMLSTRMAMLSLTLKNLPTFPNGRRPSDLSK